MGFPSPAADFAETRVSLDGRLIAHPSSTYFMRASASHYREGIIQGALLVIDSSLDACDGSLLVCAIAGEFMVKRYRKHPRPHLVNLVNGKQEELPVDNFAEASPVFGVITYIINDARTGEFDDCPVM
ncbi:S24 family peptidase [Leclercia adecarboxylata]|uniref:HumD family translesion DNA polymerase n=1 Tax=Leclercia adecarboxylata TaxID=83655 RepID=UPI00124E3F2B|nr:S24 family peptidase [Leclercia adecarboxylata]QFH50422.1 LexA family transcriptional regulator [Leclercia adecarboxylata]